MISIFTVLLRYRVLIVSLGPLLNMDSVERSGLWTGAASVAVMTALGVWYLARRALLSS